MRHAVLVGFLLALAHAAYSDEVGIVCPGGASQCPAGDTCCTLSSGQWGCCPLPKAVCCSDHQHCCPHGYKCDVSAGSCSQGGLTVPWAEKNVAKPVKVENVVCPGGQAYCPDGNTCCKLASGQWGCCPQPNAVCCSDHQHCCPHGYTCNAGRCSQGDLTVPWTEKTDAKPVKVESVVCPGGKYQCPDGNTCCMLASGQWGCCPLPNAVCCSDHQHCCPSGYTCNAGSCSRGDLTVPWTEKNVAKPVKVESVVCPDGQSECPDGNTCCKLSSGQWGCCPLPNAVCCSDHQHCCPTGYKCDVSAGTCSQGGLTVPWAEKNVAKPVESNLEGIVCPNSTSICKNSETCCKLKSGSWGCCPLVQAVCCSDQLHCCPKNTKCATNNTCVGTFGSTPMVTKTQAKEIAPKPERVPWMTKTLALPWGSKEGDVQCDATHYCPSGNTCCRLASGQWGCCPVPKAVCCSDHLHCCPSGYTCQTGTGECVR